LRLAREEYSIRVDLHEVAQDIFLRAFKAHSGLQAKSAEGDRVHQVPGRYALDQVVVVGQRVQYGVILVQRECALVAVEESPDLAEVGGRPEGVVFIVIIRIRETAQEVR
jgi:hypothetical protein